MLLAAYECSAFEFCQKLLNAIHTDYMEYLQVFAFHCHMIETHIQLLIVCCCWLMVILLWKQYVNICCRIKCSWWLSLAKCSAILRWHFLLYVPHKNASFCKRIWLELYCICYKWNCPYDVLTCCNTKSFHFLIYL